MPRAINTTGFLLPSPDFFGRRGSERASPKGCALNFWIYGRRFAFSPDFFISGGFQWLGGGLGRMAGLGLFDQKSVIAVTMPIVTAFKFCIGHRKNGLLNR
jgi:hypothetical protein